MSHAITTRSAARLSAPARPALDWKPARWRLALIAVAVAGAAAGLWWGGPATSLQADPDLARLLRGMALIKGGMVVGAIAAVWWRLSWPASPRVAIGYVAGCAALAGSTALIWQLTAIVLAALLFHSAAIAMALVGWRER
jgi:phage shock protein PspC (stress-responsive transcriptional regulator)